MFTLSLLIFFWIFILVVCYEFFSGRKSKSKLKVPGEDVKFAGVDKRIEDIVENAKKRA